MSRILFISPVRSSAKSWSFIFWRCVKLLTTDTGSVDLPDTVSGGLGTECPHHLQRRKETMAALQGPCKAIGDESDLNGGRIKVVFVKKQSKHQKRIDHFVLSVCLLGVNNLQFSYDHCKVLGRVQCSHSVVNLNLKGVSPFTLPLILPYISVGVQDNKRASNCTFDFSWVEILRSTNKHTLHRTLQRYVKKTQTRNLSENCF